LQPRSGSGEHLVNNCRRVFAAWIVRSDDRDVRELVCDPSHERTFGAVPITAAAEDADDPVAGELASGAEDVLERVRLVRVVDDDRERLAHVDRLEPAGNTLERLDARRDRIVLDPE